MGHKRKFVNFRFFLLAIFAIIISVVFSVSVLKSLVAKWVLFFLILVVAIVLAFLFIIFKKKIVFALAAMLILCLSAVGLIINLQIKVNSMLVFDGTETLITGRICKNPTYTSSGNYKLTLDDVTLVNAENNAPASGKVIIYVSPQNLEVYNFSLGNYVEAISTLHVYEIESDTLSSLVNGVMGYSFCNFYELKNTGESKISISERFKNYVYQKLLESGTSYAEVGYAMLFGDSTLVEDSTLSVYQDAGISHLLAVSGLHVSVLLVVFNFILKRLKVSPKIRLIVEFIILGAYCYLCNFSVSVTRASIMGLLAAYATARGKPYDNLSALSFAATAILLVNPIKLYSVSFVLSFSSVLIIILTIDVASRALRKIFKNRMADSLALTIGLQLGIFILSLFYFNRYPILSIISNFISVPLQSLAFGILLILTFVMLVLPFVAPLIKVFGIMTGVVVKFNAFVNGLGLYVTTGSVPAGLIILTLLIIFAISDYLFTKRSTKAAISAALLVPFMILLLI